MSIIFHKGDYHNDPDYLAMIAKLPTVFTCDSIDTFTVDLSNYSDTETRLGAILDKLETLGSDTLGIKELLAGGVSSATIIDELAKKLGLGKTSDKMAGIEGWIKARLDARTDASTRDVATTDSVTAYLRGEVADTSAMDSVSAYIQGVAPKPSGNSIDRYLNR